MSLCPYAYLELSLSGLLTVPDQGSLTTFGELFNISALDPLLPTLLIATLCLCTLLTILYYSLVVAWEVFWASRRSPSLLDPSTEVVLTPTMGNPFQSFDLTEVLVILPTDVGHLLLEDTKFSLKVLHLRNQDGLFSVLPTKNLPHLVGLENLLSGYFTNQNIQKEAP